MRERRNLGVVMNSRGITQTNIIFVTSAPSPLSHCHVTLVTRHMSRSLTHSPLVTQVHCAYLRIHYEAHAHETAQSPNSSFPFPFYFGLGFGTWTRAFQLAIFDNFKGLKNGFICFHRSVWCVLFGHLPDTEGYLYLFLITIYAPLIFRGDCGQSVCNITPK